MSRPGFRLIYLWLLCGVGAAIGGLFAPWGHVSVADIPDLPGSAYDIAGHEVGAGGWVAVALVITSSVFGRCTVAIRRGRVARTTALVCAATAAWGAFRGFRLRAELKDLELPEFGSEAGLSWGLAMFLLGAVLAMVSASVLSRRLPGERGDVFSYDDGRPIREDAQ